MSRKLGIPLCLLLPGVALAARPTPALASPEAWLWPEGVRAADIARDDDVVIQHGAHPQAYPVLAQVGAHRGFAGKRSVGRTTASHRQATKRSKRQRRLHHLHRVASLSTPSPRAASWRKIIMDGLGEGNSHSAAGALTPREAKPHGDEEAEAQSEAESENDVLPRCYTYSYIGRESPEEEDEKQKEAAAGDQQETAEDREGSGGDAAEEDQQADDEEDEQQCYLTASDDFWLEFMWLPEHAALLGLLAVAYSLSRGENAQKQTTPELEECEPGTWLDFFNGHTTAGFAFNLLLFAMSVACWLLFAINTELQITEVYDYRSQLRVVSSDSEPHFQKMSAGIEAVAWCMFAVVLIIRILLQYGQARTLRAVALDAYNWLDFVALIPSALDVFRGPADSYPNLLWLVMLRIVALIMTRTAGTGLNLLVEIVEEKGWLLYTAFVMGLCIALALSGCYYLACQNGGNPDALDWAAAGWNRMESIPAAMFFVLINLRAEHPMADEYVEANAVWPVLVSVLLGVGFFAIPTGLIADSFQEKITEAAACRRSLKNDNSNPDGNNSNDIGNNTAAGDVCEPLGEAGEPLAEETKFLDSAVYALITGLFAYATIAIYAAFTYYVASDGGHVLVRVYPVIDAACSALLLVDYGVQLAMTGSAPLRSLHAWLDLFGSLPPLLGSCLVLLGRTQVSSLLYERLAAFCVLRVFKPDRYLRSYKVLKEIIQDTGNVFVATGGLAFFIWVFFSVAMYYIERDNPDEDVRQQYASVMRSMWTMFVNLRGEFPWCDYSSEGKALETFAMVATIAIFSIPVGLFGNFFKERLAQSEAEDGHTTTLLWYGSPWEPESPSLKQVFYFIYGPAPPASRRGFSFAYAGLAIVCSSASVAVTLILTLSYFDNVNVPICNKDPHCLRIQRGFFFCDVGLIAFFVFDLVLRLIATRGRYLLSLMAVCNLLSVVGILWSLVPADRYWIFHPQLRDILSWDDYVIVLRLLRVMLLEEYSGSLKMLGRIAWRTRVPLGQAFYAMVCSWIVFATLLHLAEKRDSTEDDDVPQAHRYKHLFTSLQYTLVHLFGDFPITAYSVQGKMVHVPMALVGVGLTAAPAGIFCAAFSQELAEQRQLHNQQVRAVLRLQAAWLVRKGRMDTENVTGLSKLAAMQAVVKSAAAAKKQLRKQREEAVAADPQAAQLLAIVQGESSVGMIYQKLGMAILTFNLVCVMLESMPEVRQGRAASAHRQADAPGKELYPTIFMGFEALCTLFFIVEYCVGLGAARSSVSDRFSRRVYVFRPMRILDLLCILPCFLMAAGLGTRHESVTVETLRVLRVFRIFSWPIFEREMQCIGNAMGTIWSTLLSPLCLAIMLWTLTTVMFFHFENVKDGPQKEAFSTLPITAYYTAIFLLGEWAMVDFCWQNAIICCFYNLLGVAIFAIPVGLISEAVQVALADAKEFHNFESIGKRTRASIAMEANLQIGDLSKASQ